MDQSEMGHYPTPPHDNNVTLVPELRRSRDGWSGKGWTADGETWRVVNNIIKIRYSDADYNRVPSEEQRKRTVDNEGNFSEYVRASEDNHLYQLWMRKIGRLLADWVLQKGLYGASNGNPFYLPRTRTNDRGKKKNLTASPPWKLIRFPEGYTLWIHKSGVETDPANPRIDAYLYGAPHLGPTTGRTLSAPPAPTIFRSPMEFVEHAIWLMRRGAGQCLCKYCTPGQNQIAINLRLYRGNLDNDNDDAVTVTVTDGDGNDGAAAAAAAGAAGAAGSGSGGDGSGGGGSSSGPSAAASRGRATGTRSRRGRRAKRDRSPPIMAKDYRVGNIPSPPRPDSA
jgi:Transcription-silencing protein, cryptic loci regulator Clr2